MASKRIDPGRLKRLYDEYGSLEAAVGKKKAELKKATREAAGAEKEMVSLKKQVALNRTALQDAKADYNRLKNLVEAAENLRGEGFTSQVLKKLDTTRQDLGLAKPEDLLDALRSYGSTTKLDFEAKRLRAEKIDLEASRSRLNEDLKMLRGSVTGLEQNENTLAKNIATMERTRDDLDQDIRRLTARENTLKAEIQSKVQIVADLQTSERSSRARLKGLDALEDKLEKLQTDVKALEHAYRSYSKKLGMITSKAEQLEQDLTMEKALTLVLNRPDLAEDLPAAYLRAVLHTLAAISKAKGFDPKITVHRYQYLPEERVPFHTILEQAEKELVSRSGGSP